MSRKSRSVTMQRNLRRDLSPMSVALRRPTRGRSAGPFDRTIDVQLSRLLRKLGDDVKSPSVIKTVRGGGYLFSPAVERERS